MAPAVHPFAREARRVHDEITELTDADKSIAAALDGSIGELAKRSEKFEA